MKKTCQWLCVLIPLSGICLFYRVFDPMEHHLMLPCFLKMFTGLNCPLCGIQRAAHAFLTGDFVQAFRYNYYLAVAIPCALSCAICRFVYDKKVTDMFPWFGERVALCVVLGSLFCWFVIRNIFAV